MYVMLFSFFFFKQKTAYDMRISDWSSDVCSSDLFFRDAFPAQIDLVDSAARAVAALDEPAAQNPLAAQVADDKARLIAEGVSEDEAARRAGFRVFEIGRAHV